MSISFPRNKYFAWLAGLWLLTLAALGMIAFSPGMFVKAVSLQPGPPLGELLPEKRTLDAAGLLAGLPAPQESTRPLSVVEPAAHMQKSLWEGYGNCAHQSRGLAYYLGQHDIPYQVVHILPLNGVLGGRGHTVIRTRYTLDGQTRTGLVDITGGGLPVEGGRLLDVNDLRSSSGKIEMTHLAVHRPVATYPYSLLNEPVTLGYTPDGAMKRYFNWLERYYVPLGHQTMERYFYDGLAVFWGIYPPVYVESLSRTLGDNLPWWWIYQGCLWLLRLTAAATGLALLAGLSRRFRPSQSSLGGKQSP